MQMRELYTLVTSLNLNSSFYKIAGPNVEARLVSPSCTPAPGCFEDSVSASPT
jgi:hypothetical protein